MLTLHKTNYSYKDIFLAMTTPIPSDGKCDKCYHLCSGKKESCSRYKVKLTVRNDKIIPVKNCPGPYTKPNYTEFGDSDGE